MGLLDKFFKKSDPNDMEMTESMWGYVNIGAGTYREGYELGRGGGNKLSYEVTLRVDNFKEFKSPSGRRAPMRGWVTCKNLFGEKLPISNGEYGLYVIDQETGQRQITYRFNFTGRDGVEYLFSGYKMIVHEPWKFDILEDQTTLYATISRADDASAAAVAKGIIHYHVENFPSMVSSIRVPSNNSFGNRVKMATKFFTFVSKEISEYSREVNPFYVAEYSNLVCTGVSKANGADVDFFFFSGAHDKGFPWGDNVSFSDVGLVLRTGDTWKRYALTEHALDNLKVRLSEGTYSYEGPVFEVTSGYRASYLEMHEADLPPHLRKVNARLTLSFRSKHIHTRNTPFEIDTDKIEALPKDLKTRIKKSSFLKEMKNRREEFTELGYTTQIHRLTEIEGELVVDGVRYSIQGGRCLGEGEFGRLAGMRKPTLYYNYFCAVEPEADRFRIQVRSGTLSAPAAGLVTRETERVFGDIIGQISTIDLVAKGEQVSDLGTEEADTLLLPQEDLLEINNDHYSTATFQRRIVSMPGVDGGHALALEEDMNVIDLESVKTDRTACVAAIKDPDRFKALEVVLEETGFFESLDEALRSSGKTKQEFSIFVKPNFSFMYSIADISTFTDPSLVEHLIDTIYERGYRNIAVAEAQSTYASFFTNRDVPTLARYIGLRGKDYKIVDLSENTEAHDFGRTLGNHEVHPAWRDADFRISFAKNKTHSYAYYTLTIKNIYGALPKKNKFKEYHCNEAMGIYAPAIDFIEAFPIHYGLIDAYVSADGPFGIFADVEPNFTSTIIGGNDIVAVDWVGASKMGYDPMVSEYMQMAVERFGKPKILLSGDHSLYHGWTNVPEIVSDVAFSLMDRNFLFGDFLYSAAATMDPFFKFTPDEVGRKVGRLFTIPLRKALFEWIRGDQKALTRDDLMKMLDKDQWEYMESLIKSLSE